VDVVVKGRNVEVPDHFREHVADKLQKVERYDQKIIEVSVELLHERNPRQSDSCQRVEITCVSRGPVIRAEACASDFYSALDKSIEKLEARLRRAADRRRVHHGRRAPVSVAAATAPLSRSEGLIGGSFPVTQRGDAETPVVEKPPVEQSLAAVAEGLVPQDDDQPWHIARTKEHDAQPMTIDDALFQMELVGHDFYLFLDKDSGRPSVVYRRRKGYDYGVISLNQAA
jgi:ribosomal subunit interface protein